MNKPFSLAASLALGFATLSGCSNADLSKAVVSADTAAYFLLRPQLEQQYGYSHAVKIGNHLTAGTQLEAKRLAVPGQLIEIDREACKAK